MQIGIMLNRIVNLEQEEKVQLKYGDQLKRMKIKNGQKNITIQIQKINLLGQKL
mgnify:CR=1 FL=1